MKKTFSRLLAFAIIVVLFLNLFSCISPQEYYSKKAIQVDVGFHSCTSTTKEFTLYYDTLRMGDRYALPNESKGVYDVDFVISYIGDDGIYITFTQPLDRIVDDGKWETEISTVILSEKAVEKLTTPTDGGGVSYTFSIINREDIPPLIG